MIDSQICLSNPDLHSAPIISHSLYHVYLGLCAFTHLFLLPGVSFFLFFTWLPSFFTSSLSLAPSLPAKLPLLLPYLHPRSLPWELLLSPAIIVPCWNYTNKSISTLGLQAPWRGEPHFFIPVIPSTVLCLAHTVPAPPSMVSLSVVSLTCGQPRSKSF